MEGKHVAKKSNTEYVCECGLKSESLDNLAKMHSDVYKIEQKVVNVKFEKKGKTVIASGETVYIIEYETEEEKQRWAEWQRKIAEENKIWEQKQEEKRKQAIEENKGKFNEWKAKMLELKDDEAVLIKNITSPQEYIARRGIWALMSGRQAKKLIQKFEGLFNERPEYWIEKLPTIHERLGNDVKKIMEEIEWIIDFENGRNITEWHDDGKSITIVAWEPRFRKAELGYVTRRWIRTISPVEIRGGRNG